MSIRRGILREASWLAVLTFAAAACSGARNQETGRQLGRGETGDTDASELDPEADASEPMEPVDDGTDDAGAADGSADGDTGAHDVNTADAGAIDASATDAGALDASAEAAATDAASMDAAVTADAEPSADAESDATADTGSDAQDDAEPVDTRPVCDGDPATTFTATLRATCDDRVRIYFNGVLVAEPDTNWNVLHEYAVSVYLYPGKRNTIALEARNLWEQGGFDRGVIAELDYTLNNVRRFVDTDESWLLSTQLIDGYTDPDFDDSAWGHPVALGKSGISPWSSVPFNTDAEWLWSYLPNGDPSVKPDNETIYLRKSFYMDESGEAQPSAPCRQVDVGS